jgi:glycerophosphoryl diester phosphodiesterase
LSSRSRRALPLVPLLALSAGGLAARWLAAAPRPGALYLAGAPLLIAHRGGAGLAPENTMVAFERALAWWGADLLELDVQPTRDGEAVVFHDATLDRTTDGSGPVAEHALAEIAALDAGYRFTPDGGATAPFRGRGVRVPTLREVLRAFPDARLNVEIKDGRVQEAVLEAVREADASHRVLIAAGKRANRSRFRSYRGPVSASAEEMRAFYLHHRLGAAALYPLKVDALQVPFRYGGRQIVSERLVRDAHARNLPVHVWTVDEEREMLNLLGWGVDGIVTDRPDRLARVLHEGYGRALPPGPPTPLPEPSLERLLRS